MHRIQKLVKNYSTKKLKEIVEQQSLSYSTEFLDFAKDELIRRGEPFQFNTEHESLVLAMHDNDLRNLVEKEWDNYHLEYIEIARKEFLKRGFKYEAGNEEEVQEEKDNKKYPALNMLVGIYYVLAWIIGVLTVIFVLYALTKGGQGGSFTNSLPLIIAGVVMVIGLLATSESLRVIRDIEENTRKISE